MIYRVYTTALQFDMITSSERHSLSAVAAVNQKDDMCATWFSQIEHLYIHIKLISCFLEMIRRSYSSESQSLPNLSRAKVGKLYITLYLSFPSAFLAEGCAYDLLKETLKGQRLFPPGSSVPCVCFLQSANY